MGHILGHTSHVSIASLLGLLLAMVIEMWHLDCGPFRPIYTVLPIFAVLGITLDFMTSENPKTCTMKKKDF